MSFQIKKKNNITYGTFPEINQYKLITAIGFRKGGVSPKPYQSLNLGLHTNDTASNVLENRKKFFKTIGIHYKDIITLQQIHSNKVIIIDKKDKGKGALNYNDSVAEADAMVTNQKQLPLVIFTADCASIFFYEKKQKIIGIAHAGWKGAYLNITKKVVNTIKKMGGDLKEIIVAIGPAIGSCCYEVDKQFVKKFKNRHYQERQGKYYFDLIRANQSHLINSGIKSENIYPSNFCTATHDDLCYSYRKEGETGRMASVIMMK